MRDRLRVGRHFVMLVVAQVYVARLERREHLLHQAHLLVGRSVLDEDLRAVGQPSIEQQT